MISISESLAWPHGLCRAVDYGGKWHANPLACVRGFAPRSTGQTASFR